MARARNRQHVRDEVDLRVERRGGAYRLVDVAAGRIAVDAQGRHLDGGGHRRRAVVERLAADLRALARAAGRAGALRATAAPRSSSTRSG